MTSKSNFALQSLNGCANVTVSTASLTDVYTFEAFANFTEEGTEITVSASTTVEASSVFVRFESVGSKEYRKEGLPHLFQASVESLYYYFYDLLSLFSILYGMFYSFNPVTAVFILRYQGTV